MVADRNNRAFAESIQAVTRRVGTFNDETHDKSTMKTHRPQLKFIINKLIELSSIQIIRVRGRSMEPSIKDNSWVIGVRMGFRTHAPRRFEVIRLEDPREPNHWIIKRIVGLPGEHISLKLGNLFVNGNLYAEPHVCCTELADDDQEWYLRNEEYVVLGDNRRASTDSRVFGVVSRASIRGRIVSDLPE